MKNIIQRKAGRILAVGLVIPFVMSSCYEQDDSLRPSVTEMFEKIETSYEGGEKIEQVIAGNKDGKVYLTASASLMEKIQAKTLEDLKNIEKRFQSARTIFSGYDVGVIPNTPGTCPSWSEFVAFKLDNEDNGSSSSSGGWLGGVHLDGQKNAWLQFCRVDGRLFNSAHRKYSVLSLGNNRPSAFGSATTVYLDNEDERNANDRIGDIAPNISGNNTTFQIYTSNDATGSDIFPDFGFQYGVFCDDTWQLPTGPGNDFQAGLLNNDDENSGNVNYMSPYSGTQIIQRFGSDLYSGSIPGILSNRSTSMTHFRFLKVR